MIRINIHDAKAHLSRHLARVEKEGVTIVICRRNVPIAEIRALTPRPEKLREIGPLKGEFEVPESFFEPLPDDLVGAFRGENES